MRSLPDPAFAGDTGEADAALLTALTRYAEDRVVAPTLVALSGARLLVPVMAVVDTGGGLAAGAGKRTRLEGEKKEADVATVLMRGRDGRLALLAFSCLAALQAWDRAARPVPVPTRTAAAAAVSEGASALVVDIFGPVPFVVETAEMSELAEGHQLRPTSGGYGWFAKWPSTAT